MNCDKFFVYDQIDMQIIWKQTFDGSKMLKGWGAGGG